MINVVAYSMTKQEAAAGQICNNNLEAVYRAYKNPTNAGFCVLCSVF